MKIEELINYGIVNIDKPAGPTSHQVADFVQKILGLTKAGHSGTLDPKVTGVLVMALGKATRVVEVLLRGGKEYVGVMHLHQAVEEKKIKETIKKFFTGKIRQLPPVKSAVKREERTREIYSFELLETDGQDVLFRVSCQAGTYIRKLCHDLGKQLGVGAHMAELRRVRVGPFDESTSVTLQDLQDAYTLWKEEGNEKLLRHCLQPIENAIKNIPKVYVQDQAVESLTHGRALALPGLLKSDEFSKDDLVAEVTKDGQLIALGTALMNSLETKMKKKGLVVKTEKVFMQLNV